MNSYEPIPAETECTAKSVINAAMKVHRTLGPGLLESVYQACLCYELAHRGIPFKAEVSLPVVYEGVRLDAGLRLDLLLDNRVIAELKAVQEVHPVFEAQLLTYLKLTGLRLGLLINFNVPLLKNGIKRVVL